MCVEQVFRRLCKTQYMGVELLEHMVDLYLTYEDTAKLPSKVVITFLSTLWFCFEIFLESMNYNGVEWVNLTQMTIISTSVGRNPLEEME